ncbi:UDP-2,3-diacylglucosamine diphosphatase LpxI [Acetobacter lovaniensis]|uniref:LpxI family protein n=1 Tax=Acetobacter lovaniensis TaxID=104100 RepID=UPI00209F0AF5|nr:UDP-2,3-diacylglucosamine diphosphatase LpxI [Acetobacter lovaniensis]MCI1795284.1 UDP-2,3-diacylglucosamine diphosphatase LpxI [Acetobacter lovaniensis]MCP1238151.1 UDP-2,3-diacylglucosamine diphosphatase LpxI [Acetobacter lovaniensis]
MSAPPTAVGILAGGGPLPARVAEAAHAAGRPVFIIGFEGFADPATLAPWPHECVRLGAAGRMLSLLRAHACSDLVLIGPIRRPSLRSLYPDTEGARILARLGKALFAGDDGLLAALVRILGEEGFQVRGAHEFLSHSVAEAGVLGQSRPDAQALADIRRGVAVTQALGRLDIGQGCVVQNGVVLAVEAMEGTDAMLARSGVCRQPGDGGVLVKLLKPGQEKRADMPTIGPTTLRNAHAAGLRGIAFEAGNTLLTDRAACVAEAERLGLFLIAIDPAELHSVK